MKCALLIVAALVASGRARAETSHRIKVAVVSSVAVNIDVARVDALSQDLAEALMVDLDVDAIGGLDVRRQLPAEGIPGDCLASVECIHEVARQLGADQLLFVAMVDAGNTGAIQIDTMWVDTATNHRASRPAIALANVDNAKARFIANAHRLLPDAPVHPREQHGQLVGTMAPAVSRHLTTPTLIAGGAAVVGLGVGIGAGLTARSRYNECRAAPCTAERTHSIKTLALVADIGHVTWLVSAGLGLYLYATSGRDSRFVISPTPEGGVAAVMSGRF
jgi:hypothetical protein